MDLKLLIRKVPDTSTDCTSSLTHLLAGILVSQAEERHNNSQFRHEAQGRIAARQKHVFSFLVNTVLLHYPETTVPDATRIATRILEDVSIAEAEYLIERHKMQFSVPVSANVCSSEYTKMWQDEHADESLSATSTRAHSGCDGRASRFSSQSEASGNESQGESLIDLIHQHQSQRANVKLMSASECEQCISSESDQDDSQGW